MIEDSSDPGGNFSETTCFVGPEALICVHPQSEQPS